MRVLNREQSSHLNIWYSGISDVQSLISETLLTMAKYLIKENMERGFYILEATQFAAER